jgi:DNA-binding transcriptional regulator YdaS (Cro superfamily)
MHDIQAIFDQRRGLRMKIARALGITHAAVCQWKKVPAERVLEVERVSEIPRHELRPDLYPPHRENGFSDTGAEESAA